MGISKVSNEHTHSNGILLKDLLQANSLQASSVTVRLFSTRHRLAKRSKSPHRLTGHQEKFYIQNISVNGSDKNSFENPCFAKPAEQTRKIYLEYFKDREEIWADFF